MMSPTKQMEAAMYLLVDHCRVSRELTKLMNLGDALDVVGLVTISGGLSMEDPERRANMDMEVFEIESWRQLRPS